MHALSRTFTYIHGLAAMSVKSDGSDDGSEPEDVFGRFHGLFDEPDRETTFVYDLPSADGPPLHLELVGIRSDLRQVVTTTGYAQAACIFERV